MRVLALVLVLLTSLLAAPAAGAALRLEEPPRQPSWLRAAAVAEPQPLTGDGEHMRVVGNLPLDNEDVAVSDLELHGTMAFLGSYTEGLVIADISDPANPRRLGKLDCGGGSQYDVQLSTDAKLVLLTTDSSGAKCLPADKQGSMVIDASDPRNPVLTSFIEIEVGSHTHTLDDKTLYVNNYPQGYSKLEVFDLADPAAPRKVGELGFGGEDSIHDSYVDHRPDGRTLLYAASIGYTDVIDVTDRTQPKLLQRLADPTVTISHQAEPNHARDVLVVTDEFAGGTDLPVCGGAPIKLGEGIPLNNPILPTGGDPTDIGAIHFYELAKDGTMVNGGRGDGKIGTYNIPYELNPAGGCTVHVLWQAPDQNRLVTAWYGRGIHVVDFTDPGAARSLGRFLPTGANTWAAKPHRVGDKAYVFTGDIVRGMDVLEFTGEGWPATAGPQEVQRRQIQGVAPSTPGPPTAPSSVPPPRTDRGVSFRTRLRVPAVRGTSPTKRRLLTITFTKGRSTVAKLRFRARPGRSRVLRARVGAKAGTYRYVIRAGGTVLKRGSLRVSVANASTPSGGRTLVCRIL